MCDVKIGSQAKKGVVQMTVDGHREENHSI